MKINKILYISIVCLFISFSAEAYGKKLSYHSKDRQFDSSNHLEDGRNGTNGENGKDGHDGGHGENGGDSVYGDGGHGGNGGDAE